MSITRIIESHLCTAVGGQQFYKELKKLQTRIIFEGHYSFFHDCLLSCSYVMAQKSILSKPMLGAQAFVRGGHSPPATPLS